MAEISILGCGWLGLPLSKKLISDGHKIKGSTTTPDKISTLEKHGILPFLISLEANGPQGNVNEFLGNSEILIIDIPPKAGNSGNESFPMKVAALIPFIEQSKIQKVLLISSTSVFADENQIVRETTIPNPGTESGKQLLEAEMILQKGNFQTTILRFGGLIGNNRHPVYHLSGRENIENPKSPINLIHQNDCIGIIEKIIEKDVWEGTFNAAAPLHPPRADYYIGKAKEYGLNPPQFNWEKPSVGKTIDSSKVTQILGYEFQTSL